MLPLLLHMMAAAAAAAAAVSLSTSPSDHWWTGRHTGITDTYLAACAQAVANEKAFTSYKLDPAIRFVADPGVTKLCAKKCLKKMGPTFDPFSTARVRQSLAELDAVGSPRLDDFSSWPGLGRHHANNIRALYFALDIRRTFGDMRGWRVAEIGSGPICGVSKLLLDLVPGIAQYTVFELPAVAALCRKAQRRARGADADADPRIRFDGARVLLGRQCNAKSSGDFVNECRDDRHDEAFDLVLSTYSLSEMDLEMQRHYGEQLLNRAPNIYVATNAPPGRNMFGESERLHGKASRTTLPRGPFLRRLLAASHPAIESKPDYLRGASEIWVSKPAAE